jgi:hypothetical protein
VTQDRKIREGNLAPGTLFEFITGDFETAWDAVALTHTPTQGAGNFMFSLMAMTLLEQWYRVARADSTGAALRGFSGELPMTAGQRGGCSPS